MSDIRRTMKNNALAEVEDLDVLLFEGEVRAHRFVISPTSGVSFAGGSVVAKFVNAHQQMVQMDGAVDGTDATVTLGASCYTDPGEFKLTIFLIQGDMTAAIYACRGTVIATSGSEKTGDTEPIVEPGVDVAGMQTRLASVDGKYWGPYGASLTVDGVTITQNGPFLTLNGTTTTGAYVKLDGGLTAGKYSDLVAMAQTGYYADGSAPMVSFNEIDGSYTTVESGGITPPSPYGGFAIVILSTDSVFNNTRLSSNGPFGMGKTVSEAGTYGFILMLIANHTFDNYRIYLAVEDANRYHFLKNSLDSRYTALEARVTALEG